MIKRILSAFMSVVLLIMFSGFAVVANAYNPESSIAFPACCAERLEEEADTIDEDQATQERVTDCDCGCGSWGWCCGSLRCPMCNAPRCLCGHWIRCRPGCCISSCG